MTFEELSAAPPDHVQWYVAIGYLDAVWCRQRADDWCEAPQLTVPTLPPVPEASAAVYLALGLAALALLIRRRARC